MDKDNLNKQISEHLNINFFNNNIVSKNLNKGLMFIINGPALELGTWQKVNKLWVWKYANTTIKYYYTFNGIAPKYLDKNKWAFAGVDLELFFIENDFKLKIVYSHENKILCNYDFIYIIPKDLIKELEYYIKSLKIKEANTYLKNFNFNTDQINLILNKFKNIDTENIFYTRLPKGTWIYIGKSPLTSLPTWFFLLEDKNYYIDAYNWTEGDEPSYDEELCKWSSIKEVKKEYKTSNLPEYIKNYLIDKQIIEGASYENTIVENKNKEDADKEAKKLSLYERALKGEFKDKKTAVRNKYKEYMNEELITEEKEIEYVDIKIKQSDKSFQLTYEEVEKEYLRVNAIDFFNNKLFLKADEIINDKKEIVKNFDIKEYLKNYSNIFKTKCKSANFCIISIDEKNKIVNIIYNIDNINIEDLNYERINLIIKNEKKSNYFAINNLNYLIENLLENHYIVVQKTVVFSISEKLICSKIIEEIKEAYSIE